MKKSVKFLAAGLLALSLASCRNNDAPEDVHEHEEANKVVLTVTENGNAANVQTVTYNVGSGTDKGLKLVAGKNYDTSIKFIHNHNGVDEDLTPEIIKEKDEHFMVYQFGNASATVTRTADDVVRTDGKKVGLKTQWNVTSTAAGSKVAVKLIHAPITVDDKANNGGGAVTGGEDDVVFSVNID